eukprot:CAMPEP_0202915964 /NCGR_PEP_ID=MMETSP1392-20130828/67218_1 /ASSEMBLY_ACC=CAM_ASM_000868 /TAXON_ID=225041 /ORGANISM="Chlamydomonas chlamydogama, Strain SAG 11-48b" /LENGTH=353 /DNA_ID=CAMNT_0049608189 /DNA_START=47 /DNA_END=1105 /DNA_ORIENTATION=+
MALFLASSFLDVVVDAAERKASTAQSEQEEQAPKVPTLDFSSLKPATPSHEETPDVPPRRTSSKKNTPLPPSESRTSLAHARNAMRRHTLTSNPESRTESDLSILDEAILYASSACAHLTRGARLLLARYATLATFEDGDIIALRGQVTTCVYFVLSGGICTEGPDGSVVAELGEGQSLGEFTEPTGIDPMTPRTRQGLGGRQHSPARWLVGATAVGPTECAVVTQQQWTYITREEPRWDARKVCSFLEDVPMFGLLSTEELLQLARLVRTCVWPAGSLIYRQNSEGEDLYLIRSGFVRTLRNLAVDSPSRERLNSMTGEIGRLSSTLDTLMSPRRALPDLSQQLELAGPINQ